MGRTLKVLHVEDDFADAMLLQQALFEGGVHEADLEVVRTLRDARRRLSKERFDLVILDLRLPDSVSPMDTLRSARAEAGSTPVMVLTGSAGVDRDALSDGLVCLDKNRVLAGGARGKEHAADLARRVRGAAADPDTLEI